MSLDGSGRSSMNPAPIDAGVFESVVDNYAQRPMEAAQRPTSIRWTLRPALILVTICTAALTVIQWAWIAELDADFGWLLESFGIVGFITVASGVWLWLHRPANRTGVLLVIVGLTELAAAFGNTPNPWTALAGELMAEAPVAAITHLLLASPSGTLRTRGDRRLVIVHYLVSIGFQVPMYAFRPPFDASFEALHIAGFENWVARLNDAQGIASGVILATAAAAVWSQWRKTPIRSQRRPLAAVYAYGIFTLLSFPLTARVLGPQLQWNVYTLFALQLAIVLGIPFVYGAAVGLGGLARTIEVEELAMWLTTAPGQRSTLRDALSHAIGDPSVELFYRTSQGTFVDDAGVVRSHVGRADRRTCEIRGDDGVMAAIVYDAATVGEPALVEAAGNIAAIAIDRERLHAELLASRNELRESRQRIVEHGERERRQLSQDLHDAVQGRLVLAALHAGQLAEENGSDDVLAARVRTEIDTAITELRRLSQGMLPALLVERGLAAATRDLVARLPIATTCSIEGVETLAWHVTSAAYFVVAESLANVTKHAAASNVSVDISAVGDVLHVTIADDGVGLTAASTTGSGLRSLADRVEAIGGTFNVGAAPTRGTKVRAEIPCGS